MINISKQYNKIKVIRGGLATYYNPGVIGGIFPFKDKGGNYGIEIDIIADGRCDRESFKFFLSDVTNQITWTNDVIGLNIATEAIASWIDPNLGLATETTLNQINSGIPNSLGQKTMSGSTSVVLASDQSNGSDVPNFIRVTDAGTLSFAVGSLAVANAGLADGTFLGEILKSGEGLTFEARTFRNYAANVFTYDATGTEFLITYNI